MTNAIRDDNNVPVMLGVSAVDGSVQPLQVDENGALKSSATLSGDVTAGTEYDEDAAAAANPKGGMLIAVRRDTLSASEVSADGDNIALKATNKGQLHVKLADASDVNLQAGDGTDVTQTAGALDINIKTSDVAMGGGTQYTEGDTDASITGTAAMWEDGSNTLRAVSESKPMPIKETFAPVYEDNVNGKAVVEMRYTSAYISTATTTVIKSGGGYIDEVICVGGTLGNVTIYDNISASGTILCPSVTPVAGGVLIKHCTFTTGLTIVTAAATVITISYR